MSSVLKTLNLDAGAMVSIEAMISVDAVVSIDTLVSIDATNNCCQYGLAQTFLSVSTPYSSFQVSACYLGQRILRNEEED